MSHFAAMKTQITDRTALVTGLQNLLTIHSIPAIVEVHETPTILENGYDRNAEFTYANIIIRRSYLNMDDRAALLDIGFLTSQNGTYVLRLKLGEECLNTPDPTDRIALNVPTVCNQFIGSILRF